MKYSPLLKQAVEESEKQAIERFISINGNVPYEIEHRKKGHYVTIVVREKE